MFANLVYTEIMKCRRTIIPWMIAIGGVLAAGTALLLVSSENSQVDWNVFIARGLSCMNLLALLLGAVFTGLVFVGEYHENTVSTIFTYPISRFKFFIAKHSVVLIIILLLYLVFLISTLIFGYIYNGSFPPAELCLKFLKLTFVFSIVNFVLVPVTVLISLAIKGIGTYIFAGMSYFLAYMSFSGSDCSIYIPPCIPDKLLANELLLASISKADFNGIVIASTITFLSTFIAGAVYYCRKDENS